MVRGCCSNSINVAGDVGRGCDYGWLDDDYDDCFGVICVGENDISFNRAWGNTVSGCCSNSVNVAGNIGQCDRQKNTKNST